MSEAAELVESRRAQMPILQSRLEAHGKRMWQLPLTFFAAIAASSTIIENNIVESQITLLFSVLATLGLVLFWCFIGAQGAYLRTGRDLMTLESLLGLQPTTSVVKNPGYSFWHVIPYGALFVIAIGVCAYIALRPVVLTVS